MGREGADRELKLFDLRSSTGSPVADVMEHYRLFRQFCGRKFRVLALYLGVPGDVPHTVPVLRVYTFGVKYGLAVKSADWALEQVPEREVEHTALALAKQYRCKYVFLCGRPAGTEVFLGLVLPYLVEHELDDNQRALFKIIA